MASNLRQTGRRAILSLSPQGEILSLPRFSPLSRRDLRSRRSLWPSACSRDTRANLAYLTLNSACFCAPRFSRIARKSLLFRFRAMTAIPAIEPPPTPSLCNPSRSHVIPVDPKVRLRVTGNSTFRSCPVQQRELFSRQHSFLRVLGGGGRQHAPVCACGGGDTPGNENAFERGSYQGPGLARAVKAF